MKRSAHRDVVAEACALLQPKNGQAAVNPIILKLDTTRPTLRNRCVGWIVDAYHEINKKELILKSFEMCAAGEFNCSQASLTSPAALAALRELPKTNPALHLELTGQTHPTIEIDKEDLFSKDEENLYNDESDVPVEVVINHVTSRGAAALPAGFATTDDGSIARIGAAEDTELDVNVDDLPLAVRRPKRSEKKVARFGGEGAWEEY
ncbi:hypothetical protein DFH09DRAFT_1330120 [Mycena vulgaris]|nr:hypothetical protein DFH09DRAFT_1330120 [Mycena vulgaris]